MTRGLRISLLIAFMVIVAWATTSEACHRRRATVAVATCYGGAGYAGQPAYYGAGGGYGMAGGGYYPTGYGGAMTGYPGATTGYPGGYGYGGPGYRGYDFGRPG